MIWVNITLMGSSMQAIFVFKCFGCGISGETGDIIGFLLCGVTLISAEVVCSDENAHKRESE